MNTKLFLLSLLILIFLSGCMVAATRVHRSKVAQRAKTELIGLSKIEILACAGTPVRSDQGNKLEYFTYLGSSEKIDKSGKVPADARYCEVTFTFENNKVTDINYTGRTGANQTKDEECAFVVEKCLPRR